MTRLPSGGRAGRAMSGLTFSDSLRNRQYRFGIDANEFLAQNPIEDVDIAGMNVKAVSILRVSSCSYSTKVRSEVATRTALGSRLS